MRIKYNDAAYIMNYKKNHWFLKWFCSWVVKPVEYEGYMIACDIKLPVYALIVIPYFILSVFYNIWEGLTHGEYILSRRTHEYHAAKYDYAVERIREKCPEITK